MGEILLTSAPPLAARPPPLRVIVKLSGIYFANLHTTSGRGVCERKSAREARVRHFVMRLAGCHDVCVCVVESREFLDARACEGLSFFRECGECKGWWGGRER